MTEMLDAATLAVVRIWQKSDVPVGANLDCAAVARAVIESLREPTDAMAEAVWAETGDPCWKENAVKAWQAGIDAALTP